MQILFTCKYVYNYKKKLRRGAQTFKMCRYEELDNIRTKVSLIFFSERLLQTTWSDRLSIISCSLH
jgi:hypothetical protein